MMHTESKNKNLAIFLIILLLMALLYYWGYKPLAAQKEALETEVETLEIRHSELLTKQINRETLLEEINLYHESIAYIENKVPSVINQERIITLLNDMEEATNIQFNTIQFSEKEELLTQEIIVKDEEGHERTQEEQVSLIEVNLNYQSSYLAFKDFLMYLEDLEQRVIISGFNLSMANEQLVGSMNLKFYSLYYEGRAIQESYVPDGFLSDMPQGKTINHTSQNIIN
ncbi:hypothetical protein EDC19_0795 [Natranaerovirga hydrolytica]|uniref:Type IV pilus assembly protein PilO n=1 Tax=Natranaerovirga hydrolytica TaxID=680378 RepID=A0A4R1MYZ0_9FIRM|nr:hypothetical protein [Natranaerovirga hydrolytica]TCK98375.1 hypothetical protein EDC19_0795 [Natranaerovirga hydrolytica]